MAKKQIEPAETTKTQGAEAADERSEGIVTKPLAVKEANPKKTEPVQVMYVGPSVKGIIQKSTIYRNGLPKEIIGRIAAKVHVESSVIRNFFVPVADLSKAMEDFEKKDSRLSILYREICRHVADKSV